MAIDLFSIGRFTVHGYGLMIGLGFLIAVFAGAYQAKKDNLSADHLTSMAMWVLIIGFLGGKLLYIIVGFKDFIKDPIGNLGSEGFVVYGGIITGILTIYVYCKIKKLVAIDYYDLIAVFVPVNQGFGRIGCFLAGCCYGKRTDAFYGVIFPEGCLAPAGVKLIPTQLMMAAGDFAFFAILYFLRKKKKQRGLETGMFLCLYSVGRFIIEFFRNDYRGSIGFLSTSQFIALWTLLAGIIIVYMSHKGVFAVKDDLDHGKCN